MLSVGVTATTENTAPSGFQHFVHPQAWLWAMSLLILIFTGLLAHLQTSVPPENDASVALKPESSDGCMVMLVIDFSFPI
jgi:hypothetical protein